MVAGGGPVPGVPVVEVRLLGPVQAMRAGREVPLGGPRQRAVLALLVLEAGRVGPADRLIEELWRGSPSAGAAVTVRSYVSRLRRRWHRKVAVTARGGGYAISTAARDTGIAFAGLAEVDSPGWEAMAGQHGTVEIGTGGTGMRAEVADDRAVVLPAAHLLHSRLGGDIGGEVQHCPAALPGLADALGPGGRPRLGA